MAQISILGKVEHVRKLVTEYFQNFTMIFPHLFSFRNSFPSFHRLSKAYLCIGTLLFDFPDYMTPYPQLDSINLGLLTFHSTFCHKASFKSVIFLSSIPAKAEELLTLMPFSHFGSKSLFFTTCALMLQDKH